jgi:DNA-binding LacI/PurR family transcriptional regulator
VVVRTASGSEVARLAGVSQKTVSRVVNGEPHVSEDVRDRVLRAAEQLGYRPNSAARALLSGQTRRLGVVWYGSSLHGPAQGLVALEHAARARGYSVSLTATGPAGDIDAAVESLLAQGVDGVVVDEPVDDHPLLRTPAPVPVLTTGRETGHDWRPAIGDAVRHLLDLGHRTVHHVRGPADWWTARARERCWREALEEAGAPVPDVLEGDWSPASGHRAGLALLQDPAVTAVFCANDEMAVGLVHAWVGAGRRVPEDLSVVGLDDISSAAFQNPPLTTIRQDFQAAADAAVQRLVELIEGRASAEPLTPTAPVLVLRGSTAPPRH